MDQKEDLVDEFFDFLAQDTNSKLILDKFEKYHESKQQDTNEVESNDTTEDGQINAGNGTDLPHYRWTQTVSQIDLCVPSPIVPVKSSAVVVVIRKRHLKVGLRNEPAIIDAHVSQDVKVKDCDWDLKDGQNILVTLQKQNEDWWDRLLKTDSVLDVQKFNKEVPVSDSSKEVPNINNNPSTEDESQNLQPHTIISKLLGVLKRKRDDGESENKRVATEKDHESSSDDTNADLTSMNKALGNHLVLSRIVRLLSMEDVLNCRVVNTSWKELFDNISSLEKAFQITFEYDNKYKAYFLKTKSDYTTTTLDLLNKRLEQVKTFPCVNFHFVQGNLAHKDVSQFLRIYGRNIKRFGFNLHGGHTEYGYTKLKTFRRLLVKQAPNIEYLHIQRVPLDWEKLCIGTSSLNKLILPNLRVLKFSKQIQYHLEFLKKILSAAVNLQRFEMGNESNSFTISDADILVNLGKPNLVRHVEMHSVTPDMIPFYENLALAGPKLTRLSLCFNYTTCNEPMGFDNRVNLGKALTSIFESSRQPLRNLTLDFPFCLFPDFSLPVMTNLDVLTIETKLSTDKSVDPIILPKGLDLAYSFPGLQRVLLDLSNTTSLETLLPVVGQSLTVTKLEVCALMDPQGLSFLSELFPNVDRLSLMKVKEFSKVGRGIWRYFKGIKVLQLEVMVGYGFSKNSFPLIDSVFTGFSEGTCRMLRDNPTRILDVEKERKDVSILDLKDLVDLTLIFSDSACRTGSSCNLLTPVAGQFAFRLKSNLNIRIGCHAKDSSHQQHMREALEVMTPYLNNKKFPHKR